MITPAASLRDLIPNRRAGVALVIVLSFIVLLMAVLMAYFSKSLLERQISQSSTSQSVVQHLADGAANTIISDLRSEIAAGSVVTNIVTGSVTNTLYFPKAASNAVPAISGSSGSNGLENLLKRSSSADPFYPGGSSRAAASSSTNSSANGRYISPARWNKPLLIPATAIDNLAPAPAAGFVPPDWIYVARDGSNPKSVSQDIVGRYAYAIYDEGGLLDANVAGYPASLAAADTAYKNALSFADLTQIPGLTNQATVDVLLNWRNAASYGGSATNYVSYVNATTNGFLRTGPHLSASGKTDRQFISRQQLIDFFNDKCGAATNFSVQSALQYLGTFTRDLNQPSFVPATFSATSPAPKVNARSAGGNTAVVGSVDGTQQINPSLLTVRAATAFDRNEPDPANPSAPVKAVPGEPLVKKRFALNRLAWLTYAGPVTLDGTSYNPAVDAACISRLKSTYGFTDSFLLQGTPENIFKYFGLAWTTVSDPVDGASKPVWVYDHSALSRPTGASAAGKIKVLSNRPLASSETDSVAAAGREADFFELLKATVNVGAIAKPATDGSVSGWALAQYNRDIQVDFAIIQIGANMIDQSDLDGFPTTIYFDDGSASSTYGSYRARQFHGIENLPYLYRLRSAILKAALPVPWAGNASYTTNDYPNTALGPPAASGPLAQTGVGCLLQIPEVWNPHDWTASGSGTTQSAGLVGPTKLRTFTIADSGAWYNSVSVAYSTRSSTTATSNATLDPGGANAWFGSLFADGSTINAPRLWTPDFNNTVMTFDMAHAAFREPTALFLVGKNALAAGGITNTSSGAASRLSAAGQAAILGGGGIRSGPLDPAGIGAAAGQGYAGFCIGAVPLRWVVSGNATTPSLCRSMSYTRSDTSFQQMVYLQFQDSSGNWITYDEKYANNPFNLPNQRATMGGASQSFFDTGNAQAVAGTWSAHALDPRSARFGMPARDVTNSQYGWNSDFPSRGGNAWVSSSASDLWIDGSSGVVQTMRPDASAGVSLSQGSGLYMLAAGWYPGTTILQMSRIGTSSLRAGLLSQNSPSVPNDAKITTSASSAIGSAQGGFGGSPDSTYQFYADPDGVVRRAMAGYVSGTSSTLGLPLATANSYSGGVANRNPAQSASRPMILNRPFRSVAELGYVFSGTPWRNLDFFTPESGYAALLDVFCVSDNSSRDGLAAGKVNLNTRSAPVLQAVIAGAYKDEWQSGSTGDVLLAANGSDPAKLAAALVARTSNTTVGGVSPPANAQPLANISELVGRWQSASYVSAPGVDANNRTDGSRSYSGFMGDASVTSALGSTAGTIQRYREAPLRALSNSGQVRVWNLMIDVIAQTGRCSKSASSLNNFIVDGEQRCWLHVAIDRYTGAVIDRQLEVVKE